MKWGNLRRSDNVEDQRGSRGPAVAGGVGIGGVIIALVAGLVFGVNPIEVLQQMEGGTSAPQGQSQPTNDRDSDFVKAILGDTEDTWGRIFQQQLHEAYQPPHLVLFSGSVNSGCGAAQTASGPFYCPRDEKVYLDMSFFQQIQATSGSNADFAQAYAIAHEVGHHVQNLLGISGKVQQLQSRSNKTTANALSVRLELQADCLAGVWGHYTEQRGIVNTQDVQGALNTAAQIGDDYLQKQAQGYAVPDAFTHGSSQQRVDWFSRGLKTGDVNQCNTFAAK